MPHKDVGPVVEGRAWWVELQRQRATRGRHRSGAPGAAATCELQPSEFRSADTASQPEHQLGHLAALSCRSQAWLQLLSQPDVGCSNSRSCHLHQHAHQQQPALADLLDQVHDEPGADKHWAELLRGGLISNAVAASEAWRETQRQQLAAEQQEWQRQMDQRTGNSLPIPGPTTKSSSRVGGGATSSPCSPTNPAPEQGAGGANEAASGEGSWDCSSALPAAHLAWSIAAESRAAAAAAFHLGGITDSEVRHHITALLLRGSCPNLGPIQPQAATATPAAAARPAASPYAVGGQPSAVTASASGGALLDPYSAVATAGGDVGRGGRDPLLQAWLVTRTQPELPIRGYTPPPSRAACRLVAAEEMIQFYRRQRKIQGCFFPHLRLTRCQAGRGASETDSVELLAAGEDPVVVRKRSSLGAASSRASIHQAKGGGPVPEIAAHSQLSEWAREHCRQAESAAAEQLRTGGGRDAEAALPAAAGGQQHPHGAAAGSSAALEQRGDSTAAPPCVGNCRSSASGSRRCSAVAAAIELQSQQAGQEQWQDAEALPGAAEQLAERERRRAASQALQTQWLAVRLRLPDCVAVGCDSG